MICGKIIYPSREVAESAVRGIKKDKRPNASKKKPVTAYYCKACRGFHLTTNKQRLKVKTQHSHDIVTRLNRLCPEQQKSLRITDFTFKPLHT
jgi:hypothetical protein